MTSAREASVNHTSQQHRLCTPSILRKIDHHVGKPSVVKAQSPKEVHLAKEQTEKRSDYAPNQGERGEIDVVLG